MAEMSFPAGNISQITEKLDDAPVDIRKVYTKYITDRGLTLAILDGNMAGLIRKKELLPHFPKGQLILKHMEWGLLVPYYNIDKSPTEYFGVRILTEEKRATFGGKSNKFIVPAGNSRLYFPLSNPEITDTTRCIITESAFKAIAASLCGYFAIGLNGCWGFSHNKKALLEDFNTVPWSSFKDVVFVPDSDWETNEQVASAITVLADRMRNLYDVVLGHVPLVGTEDQKIGIDDYLAANGLSKTREFLAQPPKEIELSGYMAAMHKLNDEVCYIRNNNMFVNVEDNYTMSLEHLNTQYAPLKYEDTDGKVKKAPAAWVMWENRNDVKQVTNQPGKELYLPDMDAINLWRPGDVVPNNGSVDTHLKFITAALPKKEERKWVQQWIGHLVQHQDIKMLTSVVFYSSEQGTGKTMLGGLMRALLGRHNGAEITQEIFKKQYNGSYASKQIVVINETAKGKEAEAFMEKLKTFVSEDVVMVREMRINPYEINNFCHVVLTTNNIDALKIEPSDRRFGIFELMSQFRSNASAEDWGQACWQWHHNPTNIGALLNYYQQVDLKGFSPANPAPMTQAKIEMEMASRSDAEMLCAGFSDDRKAALEELGLRKDLRYIESQILLDALNVDESHMRSYTTKLGAMMKKYGFGKERLRANGITRRAYDLDPHLKTDITRFTKDCVSPRGKKYDG